MAIDSELGRAVAGEAIGTFTLVVMGCGAIVVGEQTGAPGRSASPCRSAS